MTVWKAPHEMTIFLPLLVLALINNRVARRSSSENILYDGMASVKANK